MLTKMLINEKICSMQDGNLNFQFLNDAISASTHSYIEIDAEVIIA